MTALVWPLARPEPAPARSTGEVAYQSLPDKPQGEARPGRAGVEPSAIAVAHWLHALPATSGAETPCAEADLHVSWTEPPASAEQGAFVPPLGPAPTATTDAVNGIVQCTGSESYAFMGFQARYADDRWEVMPTENPGGETDLPEVTTAEPEAPSPSPVPMVALDGRTFTAAIEGLAAYEPQRTCDGTSKPGTTALRNLLLKDNAGSRNLGIVRGCSIGGTSEHKEGRAFDWGVNVRNAKEKAQADAFVAKLLATDQYGNQYALARRMGVMYVIWNQRIWSAYRAGEGWRPYHGASAHTDHVHISLSWAGAQARTSFWSGNVVQVLLASAPTAVREGVKSGQRSTRRVASVSTQLAATDQAKRDADRRAAWLRREAARAAAHQAWEQKRAEDEAARDAKRAEWQAKWEAEKAVRDQARQEAAERYAADKAAREQAYAERRAAEQAAAEKAAAERAARDAARKAAAEKAAAERAARDASRRRRWSPSTTTTTSTPAPTTSAPAPTTSSPATTTTTEG